MTAEDARQAASEAWRGLVDFWTKRNRWVQVAGELGISPGHAKALTLLAVDDPPPMGCCSRILCLPYPAPGSVDDPASLRDGLHGGQRT